MSLKNKIKSFFKSFREKKEEKKPTKKKRVTKKVSSQTKKKRLIVEKKKTKKVKKNLVKKVKLVKSLKKKKKRLPAVKKETKKKKVKSESIVKKITNNPVISPRPKNFWESWQTFNPAAVLIKDKIHFLYRAIGNDGVSRFGYANSKNGFELDERDNFPAYQDSGFRREYAYYSASGGSWSGCEDPRMAQIDDKIYVTYTSCNGGLRVGLLSIKVSDFLNREWKWSQPKLISPPNHVNKNWVIFPEKINGKYAILHSISPEISIAYRDSLDFKEGEYIQSQYHPQKPSKKWDSFLRGIGPTPIKTKYGWLVFYHAMNHEDMGKYKVGAMILDLKDPTKILHRSQNPILEPTEYYEMEGYKPGVVYILGSVIKEDKLILYYGGADSYVCVAYANLEEFLEDLMRETKKPLKKKILKTKK